MNTTEFDEIRPYNDEELSGVFEELIADPAFQKVVAGVIPDEIGRASCREECRL